MSNFELIDDYLSGKLNEQEKSAFEQQAASDPSLQADLELQKHIITGIQKARMLELKAMLGNVPIAGGGAGILAGGKLVATIVTVAITAGIIGTGTWLYFKKPSGHVTAPVASGIVEEKKIVSDSTPVDKSKTAEISKEVGTVPQEEKSKSADSKAKEKTNKKITTEGVAVADKSTAKSQPKIDVIDPSEDMTESKEKPVSDKNGKQVATASRIAVDTDASNKKYNFHYQFTNDKLILYGAFDKSLYEVLEINGSPKSVFLFYKGNYYLLNDRQHVIAPLEAIRDQALLKKLKEYKEQ